MRFKQRLKVIQSLEDTAKRSVVSVCAFFLKKKSSLFHELSPVHVCVRKTTFVCMQVRAIMTDSAFSIEELEELYVLFKVRTPCLFRCVSVHACVYSIVIIWYLSPGVFLLKYEDYA